MRRVSLRRKVALAFSALTIILLLAQALGLKALVERQEEKFIDAIIDDDMRDLLLSYRSDPALLPPLDTRLDGHVSQEGGLRLTLPSAVSQLAAGTHEIMLDGREIHVAVNSLGVERIYRIYDFSVYERRFKQVFEALLMGTGVISLLTIWLAYSLSGLLVGQVAGLARQVRAIRSGAAQELLPGRYDEIEVAELVDTFNDYHRRMAQMIAREKEFTGNVSHELRTPLTAIKTGCELLAQDSSLSEKSRARLKQIERACANMEAMVNALLSLAREESAAAPTPVALREVIAGTLADFATRLATQDIAVTNEIDPAMLVQVHAPALAMVLSNLVDNAVSHTNQGRLHFAYAYGELRIADTGSGIPSDELPRVFERFYHRGLSRGGQPGFGIGLAVVKKICERNNWPIRIASEVGAGTEVFLGLPLAS